VSPFLLAVLVSLAAALAPGGVVQVAPGVHLLPGTFTPGTQPDGNTVILDAPGGLIVVDTGRHPAHVQSIVAYARSARRPVAAIVNTHWHLDHVGGNAALRDEFPAVKVLASGALHDARTGFLASYRKQLVDLVAATPDAAQRGAFEAEVRLIDQGARLEPDEVVTSGGRRSIAGLPLDVGLEKDAVTAGDVWRFEPKSRVLVAGDLVTLPAPLFDTAKPEGWKASLDRLASVNFKVLVPGHGRPMTRADFERYRAAFTGLLSCAAGTQAKEACISSWQEGVGSLVPDEDRTLMRSLLDYYVAVLRKPR
jgi:glyoxylase-like metal-dependent hydrolase (beta-lactamase superfamily II)